MKLILESTTKVVKLESIDCRIWEGQTGRGINVVAFIPIVRVRDDQDVSEFEAELTEQRAPSPEAEAIPLRMIL